MSPSDQTFAFTDAERSWHIQMRGLTTDGHRREVLVGLTVEETEFYVTYSRDWLSRVARNSDDQKRRTELHKRHELARYQVIGAEVQLRNEKPSRQ